MTRFEDSIVVDVPVRTAYDQWTQFEEFPRFMEGVEKVVQRDDRTLDWTAKVAGQTKEWRAKITDQTPDTRIAWKSTSGNENAGAVMFEPVGDQATRITLKLDADPEGPIETIGANVGLLDYLMTFIVGHGVLELFAIAVAGAAGFLLGLALIAPGDLTRREALVVQGRTAIRMVGMVVVLLIVAGLIEGLASASGASVTYRVAVSSASAVFLLLYLANGARWASTLDGP